MLTLADLIQAAPSISGFPWEQVERGGFIAVLIWVQIRHDTRVDRIITAHMAAWTNAMDSYQETLEHITQAHTQLVELVRGHQK